MPAGRLPKPTALKVLHGDFKKNPQRANKNEPNTRGPVEQPNTLSPGAKLVWEDLAPKLIKVGILTPVDVPTFAEFCESTVIVRLARMQVAKASTGQLEIPAGAASPFTAYSKAIGVFMLIAGRFGLTPSDRARLIVAPEGSNNGHTDDLISSG